MRDGRDLRTYRGLPGKEAIAIDMVLVAERIPLRWREKLVNGQVWKDIKSLQGDQ